MIPEWLEWYRFSPNGRGGWLPAIQTIQVVFESLIWPFCLAFGHNPPNQRQDRSQGETSLGRDAQALRFRCNNANSSDGRVRNRGAGHERMDDLDCVDNACVVTVRQASSSPPR